MAERPVVFTRLVLPWRGSSRARAIKARRRLRGVVSALAAVAVLLSMGALASQAAANEEDSVRCGEPVSGETPRSKHINLVIDDSASMFYDGPTQQEQELWSYAKYSLEAFAALMGEQDSLDVYRMSDFSRTGNRQPKLRLDGSNSVQDNVRQIHEMDLIGKGTPYQVVQQANSDLDEVASDEKWLVILTDGAFRTEDDEEVPVGTVQDDIYAFVTEDDSEANKGVAFLAMGEDAQIFPGNPGQRVVVAAAPTTAELLREMGGFANRIFERDIVPLEEPWIWSADVDLDQVIVFAQGTETSIGPLTVAGEAIQPDSQVLVSWSDNPQIIFNGARLRNVEVTPVPAQDLQGQIARFSNVPSGEISFDVGTPRSVNVFYKPKVSLGIRLEDEAGAYVAAQEINSGTYILNYGFMSPSDPECQILDSESLNVDEGAFTADIYADGELVETGVKPGTAIDLPAGEVTIDVAASYLGGVPAQVEETRSVLPRTENEIATSGATYNVSEMGDFPPQGQQIPLEYVIVEEGVARAPTEEEWAAISNTDFAYDHQTNLEFEVEKSTTPGQLSLLVRAPEGDVYAANTGNLEVTVRETTPGKRTTEATVPIEVVDDISGWDRFLNWLKTDGWKWLLALLLLIIILGYIFKRRFPKSVRRKPSMTGTPNMVGMTATQASGKFKPNGIRKLMPFVADRATMTYVPPGTPGFRAFKLKAGPGKSMLITNWKDLAKKGNVEVNGMPIDESTRGPVRLGASSEVVANTPQMKYSLVPNVSASGKSGQK